MNKIIIGVVILVIIATSSYFLFINYNSSANNTDITSQPINQETLPAGQNIVVYTDNGYSPNSIKIKAGETVTFKNESSKSMWPASAMHPTHNQYPTTGGCLGSTFDSCQGIQPGDSWSFKFDLVGNWKYHDHLSATNFGSIIVE